MELALKAAAKVNLLLDIVGRRSDGYHLLDMLMVSVSLYDTITLSPREGYGRRLICERQGVPLDETNLALKSASAFSAAYFAKTGTKLPGVEIRLEKRIPHAAGLAGGTADGAGVLLGLNRMHGLPFTQKELLAIGERLGADFPFCLTGGVARVQGIGEVITSMEPLPECWLVIAKPKQGVSTAESFRRFDKEGRFGRLEHGRIYRAAERGELRALGACMENVLEPSANCPQVEKIKRQMLREGALGACMSGSGSSVVGLFDNKRLARQCHYKLTGEANQCFLTQPVAEPVCFIGKGNSKGQENA